MSQPVTYGHIFFLDKGRMQFEDWDGLGPATHEAHEARHASRAFCRNLSGKDLDGSLAIVLHTEPQHCFTSVDANTADEIKKKFTCNGNN